MVSYFVVPVCEKYNKMSQWRGKDASAVHSGSRICTSVRGTSVKALLFLLAEVGKREPDQVPLLMQVLEVGVNPTTCFSYSLAAACMQGSNCMFHSKSAQSIWYCCCCDLASVVTGLLRTVAL